jgi:hypothetical protein
LCGSAIFRQEWPRYGAGRRKKKSVYAHATVYTSCPRFAHKSLWRSDEARETYAYAWQKVRRDIVRADIGTDDDDDDGLDAIMQLSRLKRVAD